MKMLRNNVLVKKLNKEKTGKVVMPDFVKDDWYRGKVLAVGKGMFTPDGERIPNEVKKGNIVIFPPPQYSPNYPTIVVDGEECIVMNEANIWGIEN